MSLLIAVQAMVAFHHHARGLIAAETHEKVMRSSKEFPVVSWLFTST
jgi:hypothetical protein